MRTFEPKIIGFLCNWCSYAGADLAGVSRFQYPTNLRVVRVMCSGRVDPGLIFSSFLAGFDGVTVLGCHLGDCHYLTGNYHAEKKMQMVEKLLELAGLDKRRFYLDWVSAAEGERFARIVTEFTGKIKELGPLEKDKSLTLSLKAAKVTTQGEKILLSSPASCKGCGLCGASCPQRAITNYHFTEDQLLAEINTLAM